MVTSEKRCGTLLMMVFLFLPEAMGWSSVLHARGRVARNRLWLSGSQQQHEDEDEEEMCSLSELLSTCVDACTRGCREIRRVRKKGSLDVRVLKSSGDPKSVLTEADLQDIQRARGFGAGRSVSPPGALAGVSVAA